MKASVGLNKSKYVALDPVVELTSESKDMAFAQQVADKAITLVRDDGRALPLRDLTKYPAIQPKKRLVTILLAEAFESSNGREFEKALKVRRPNASVYYVDNRTASAGGIEVLRSVADAEEVVVVAYLVHHGARQFDVNGVTTTVFGLMGASGRLLQQVLAVAQGNTVVIALGSPYLIENFPQIQNYICAYAMASTSEISAVKALFGEIQNHARLPVTLPGIAPRGFSVPWPAFVRSAQGNPEHN